MPKSVAEDVIEAFTAYTNGTSEGDQRRTFTYQKVGETSAAGEMLLALDFGEIISIKAVPGNTHP